MKKLYVVLLLFLPTIIFAQATALSPDGAIPRQTLTPLLSWTADPAPGPPDVTHYRVTVATASPVVGGVGVYTAVEASPLVAHAVTVPLTNNTTYFWIVESSNGGAGGPWVRTSAEATFQTIMANPILTYPTGGASFVPLLPTVTWTFAGGTGGVTFDIELSLDGGGTWPGGLAVIGLPGTSTSYTYTTPLTANTSYVIRVRAKNGIEADKVSSENAFTTIGAPTATAATFVTATSFQANWNAYGGATSYYIDVATDVGFTSILAGYNNLLVSPFGTSYVVTGLTAGTTYYYRVRSNNGTLTTPSSNTITVVTIPPAPVATAATLKTQTSFQANWNAALGATGYRVDVGTSPGGTDILSNVDAGNVLLYSVTPVANGKNFYYKIRAYNGNGTSGNSNEITALTIPSDINTAVETNVTGTSFTANWTAPAPAQVITGYYLDVATDAGFTAFVTGFNNLNVGAVVTYNVTGLSANTNYWYRVRAYNASGTSGNTGTTEAVTTGPLATAATLVTQTTFQANWTAVGGAASYSIDIGTTSGGTDIISNLNVGNVIFYSVSGLTAGTTYYYRVRSNLNASNSNTITVVMVPPAPVVDAETNLLGTSFSANWFAALGATGYFLDVATDAGFTSFVTGFNNLSVGNVLTYNVTGLTPATTYYYRVRASNTSGTSGNSGTETVSGLTSPPSFAGGSPANYAVGVSIQPSFAWTGAGPSYWFELDNDSNFSSPLVSVGPTASTSYDFLPYVTTATTVLSNSTVYYWRIRQTGSAWVSREFQTCAPAVPLITTISLAGTDATLYWYPLPYQTGLKYDVLYSTNSNMSGFLTAADLTTTNHTLTGLTIGTTYYVQVRAKNSAGTVIHSYSTVSNFTVPGLPTPYPSYPTGGVTVYSNPPYLYWYIGSIFPGLEYEVRYGTSNTDTTPADGMIDTGTNLALTTNLYTTFPAALTAGQTYYWQVRSKSGANYSPWSSIVSFKVFNTVPTSPIVPFPSYPTGGATVYFNPPTFYWYLGQYATGLEYYVEWATSNSPFTAIGNSGWISTEYFSLTTNLSAGQTYYWRVKSRLAAPPNTESSWSTIESFVMASTVGGGVTAPTPSTPIGGVTIYDLTPTLEWLSFSTSTLEYRAQWSPYPNTNLSGELNHATVVTTGWQSGLNYTLTVPQTLTAGVTYYWQVQARLQSSPTTVSAWSYVATFTTAASATAIVPLIGSPNYGQPINNTTAILSWRIPTISSSPLTYDVNYSKEADFKTFSTIPNVKETNVEIKGLEVGKKYYWRVLSKANNGSVSMYSATGSFSTSNSVTSVEENSELPSKYELHQNYPNPFNPTTRITFSLSENSFVSLKIYDMLGREIKSLVSNEVVSGNHSVEWNGTDNFGNKVASGTYVYRITAGNFISVKKMLLIK
ncbi:MAG: T9SS type A sorting domain-containing protein [Ignavibacteria bacterium]|nr:T9SS type A sorting domain-containing protein [Ignavibacteria bacterium]